MTAASPSAPTVPRAARGVCITVTPWVDPLVDEGGHDPRSAYVERFWLPTLGPTACWLLRRIVDAFDVHPDGFRLDVAVTAHSLGVSGGGEWGAFARAFKRSLLFGLAHRTSEGYAVRRFLPDIPRRHLARLPAELRHSHAAWRTDPTVGHVPGVLPLDALSGPPSAT